MHRMQEVSMLKRRSAAAGFSAVMLCALALSWTGPAVAEPAGSHPVVSHGGNLPPPFPKIGDLVFPPPGRPFLPAANTHGPPLPLSHTPPTFHSPPPSLPTS